MVSRQERGAVEVLSSKETEKTEKYALLSVSDKTGIVDLARTLDQLGYRIISTGGTARVLANGGIPVVPIQEITGNPECFDGRMKTISFPVESGILYNRQNPSHLREAQELGIKPIDIVVCNLYPFEQTIQKQDVTQEEAIENIDVGGPTMVRAAAKNFENVLVVVDPRDYENVGRALESGTLTKEMRQALATKAFDHLSFYDAQIAGYLRREKSPQEIALPGRKSIDLRYGENPHQRATVYFEPKSNSPLRRLERLSGRELSYVNFTDIGAGLESVRLFNEPAAVVIKHNSPCGIALAETPVEALIQAVAADPESAFGGVITLNQTVDLETARAFAGFKEEEGVLIDIIAAPAITEEAKEFIKGIRKSTGIYTFGEIPPKRSNPSHIRFFDGGFLIQEWDDDIEGGFAAWKVVTEKSPTGKQLEQMKIGWKFITRIKSNSVIVVDPELPMTRGIGSGQTSRFRSTRIALEQAGKHAEGAILVSDSFFPQPDSAGLAVKCGIGAIVQQGGSVKDRASIEVANEAGIPMVFTYRRAFWH